MRPLVLGAACLAAGWAIGSRRRAGAPSRPVSPSDAGRSLGQVAREKQQQRLDDTTDQLRREIQRSRG